jgi:hypothetical protein
MENIESFLGTWNQVMMYATYGMIVIGLVTFFFHEFKLMMMRDPKEKYDYINHTEINVFTRSALAYVLSATLFFNTLGNDMIVKEGMFGFVIRIFITACFFTVAYYLLANLIKIYYPTYLERKLQHYRRKPRISPEGNIMRLLSESEEDAHLDAGMQAEEKFFTVDYDIWVDDKTGYKKIEKYMGFEHAEQCPECEYFTLKPDYEKLVVAPTMSSAGIAQRHFVCGYCKHRETHEVHIAELSANTVATEMAAEEIKQ